MQTASGFAGPLVLCILPIFLITACGDKTDVSSSVTETSTNNPTAQQVRALRSQTQRVEPSKRPETESTNVPDATPAPPSGANGKAVEDFEARLRGIIGDSYVSNKEIKERAERGDPDAQLQLGQRAFDNRDFAEALKWYQLAASQGNVKAQKSMGVLYMTGNGVEKDIAKAVEWYRMAANQGDAEAQYSLGLRYVNGDVVGQNFEEAAKWFALAADQGVTDAQLSLARRYAAGEGVPQDVSEAYKWCLITEKYGTYQAYGAKELRTKLEETITPEQIAAAKTAADAFSPKK